MSYGEHHPLELRGAGNADTTGRPETGAEGLAKELRETVGHDAADSSSVVSPRWQVVQGDCREVLADLPAASVDAVVCDPPYGIDFQQAAWDGKDIRANGATQTGRRLSDGQALEVWAQGWAAECLRVLKPGGHLAAFGAPRTFHRVACGIEDAGLELRDTLMWLYGTGMPKSRRYPGGTGTSLKPAWEPILLARKPPTGTVAANADEYGTGRLNIDACRSDGERYPANVLLGHTPDCTDGSCAPGCALRLIDETALLVGVPRPVSRLFYCPKASRKERDAGCDHLTAQKLDLFPQRGSGTSSARNAHPTVKPLTLMRWLVRLVTPPGGLVVDPFCGSGSTGAAAVSEERAFVGIEREAQYVQIARSRIAHWSPEEQSEAAVVGERLVGPFASSRTGTGR